MNLREKLKNLGTEHNLVLFRWSVGRNRIAGDFVLLSDLRLNTLACDGGTITLSVAAPVLYMDRGRPVVKFADKDVLTVSGGERQGINTLPRFMKEGEECVPAKLCCSRRMDRAPQPRWASDRVLSMGCAPVYPVSHLVMPDTFRLTRRPETLRPVMTTELCRMIGGEQSDGLEELVRKFHRNIGLFGHRLESGYVVAGDVIASGGCAVVSSRGMSDRSVRMMPLSAFREDVRNRHWEINTGEPEDGLE